MEKGDRGVTSFPAKMKKRTAATRAAVRFLLEIALKENIAPKEKLKDINGKYS